MTLREIADSLVSRLESIPGLSPERVGAFSGAAGEFAEQCRVAPFAGVSLESASYTDLASDSTLAREDLAFRVTVIVQDFRGPRYSLEAGYVLLESLREGLNGADPGLEGLAPFRMEGIRRDGRAEEQGLEVFEIRVATWRVVGRE